MRIFIRLFYPSSRKPDQHILSLSAMYLNYFEALWDCINIGIFQCLGLGTCILLQCLFKMVAMAALPVDMSSVIPTLTFFISLDLGQDIVGRGTEKRWKTAAVLAGMKRLYVHIHCRQ